MKQESGRQQPEIPFLQGGEDAKASFFLQQAMCRRPRKNFLLRLLEE